MFIFTLPCFGTLAPKNLSCSGAGTDILLVNGISWSRDIVQSILEDEIEPSIPKSFLDKKSPAGNFVKFKYSYNHSAGFQRDIIESLAQKLSQNFNISYNITFVIAYYSLNKGIIADDFINSIIQDKKITFSDALNYIVSTLDSSNIEKMINDAIETNISDTRSLKSSMSTTLLAGKKLILITESQGNLFAKQAILDFQSGEKLNNGVRTGIFENFENHVGQLLIAPPTGSLLLQIKELS